MNAPSKTPHRALPLIRLQEVNVTLNGRRILQDITWELRPGEHWVVLGPNGAGKTTFLSLVRGNLWPDQAGGGTREFCLGPEPTPSPIGPRQRMGMVSDELQQRYLRFGWDLRAEEVVATGFFDTPMLYQPLDQEQRARLADIFQLPGLAHLSERRFLSLSQGQARLLLMARALAALDLAGGPCLLILDEVCEGLDRASRLELLAAVDRLAREHDGLHLLMTAHRVEDVPGVVNRVLLLDKGCVIHQGPRPGDLAALLRRSGAHDEECDPGLGPDQAVFAAHVPLPLAPDTPLFHLRNCDCYRNQTPVLKDLNWTMLQGEQWAVLGANGAGKSSFLELLYGTLHPALGGQVRRFGLDDAALDADGKPAPLPLARARAYMSLVSPALQAQFLAFEGPPMSGEECVLSGLTRTIGPRFTPSTDQRELAARWMAALGIMDLAPEPLDQLSYGQLRRLLLARAMIASPRVLLLDEPCSGLDTGSRDRMLALLSRLAAQGTALVVATHRRDELVPEINRELRLAKGVVEYAGPRADGQGT